MLTQIKNWLQYYAREDYPDKRAVLDFVECESTEVISSFVNELNGIRSGRFSTDVLGVVLGNKRLARFENYESWAIRMMQFVAEAKR